MALTAYTTAGRGRHQSKIDRINAFVANPDAGELTVEATLTDQLIICAPLLFTLIGAVLVFDGVRKAISGVYRKEKDYTPFG